MKNRFDCISDDAFVEAFKSATCLADIRRTLALPGNGTTNRYINSQIKKLALDRSELKDRERQSTKQEKICPVCGNHFFVSRQSDQVTCSFGCSNTYFRSGENHWTSRLNRENYKSKCFRHHEHKCCICGETNIVAVHHYDGNHDNNDICNLIPLCPTHHQYVHSQFKDLVQPKIDKYLEKFKSRMQV